MGMVYGKVYARVPEHFQKWYGSGQNRGLKGRVRGV